MHELNSDEAAILALLAMRPLSDFPPQHHMIARRLARRGLVAFSEGQWHPTAQGLDLARRALH
jgi:hypothetical protein